MWSLSDIQRLNAAASDTARKTILKAVHQHLGSLGNPIHCDYCANEAEEVCSWFDIFSDDAKGVVAIDRPTPVVLTATAEVSGHRR